MPSQQVPDLDRCQLLKLRLLQSIALDGEQIDLLLKVFDTRGKVAHDFTPCNFSKHTNRMTAQSFGHISRWPFSRYTSQRKPRCMHAAISVCVMPASSRCSRIILASAITPFSRAAK